MGGGGGWLEQLGIRLSQLPTKLKLKLKMSFAIPTITFIFFFHSKIILTDLGEDKNEPTI